MAQPQSTRERASVNVWFSHSHSHTTNATQIATRDMDQPPSASQSSATTSELPAWPARCGALRENENDDDSAAGESSRVRGVRSGRSLTRGGAGGHGRQGGRAEGQADGGGGGRRDGSLGRQRAGRRKRGSRATSAALLAMAVGASTTTCVGGGWVDPDTEEEARSTKSLVDGREYQLVFSDEFNVPDRSFHDGHDPRWTALHKDDYTNAALQFYDKDALTTTMISDTNGALNITTSSGACNRATIFNWATGPQFIASALLLKL